MASGLLSVGASATVPSPRLLLESVCVAADAHGDADDALVAVFLADERAVVGDGLVGGEVVEAVLDEVGPLHAGEQQLGLLAVEFGLHGAEDGVVLVGWRRGSSWPANVTKS